VLPVTVFINFVFYIYLLIKSVIYGHQLLPCMDRLDADIYCKKLSYMFRMQNITLLTLSEKTVSSNCHKALILCLERLKLKCMCKSSRPNKN